MGWGFIGAAVITVVGSAISNNQQQKGAKKARAIQQQQLDAQQEQYNDWKEIYGPLQEDLGTFMKNLNGDSLAAPQLAQIQASTQASQKQIDEQLAQRGLGGSGIEASLMTQNTLGGELAEAKVSANADMQAMNMKQNFLSAGLGQGTQLSNNIANTRNNQANLELSSANQQAQNTQQLTNTLAGAASYYGRMQSGQTNKGGNQSQTKRQNNGWLD